jgi:putative lipoprotein
MGVYNGGWKVQSVKINSCYFLHIFTLIIMLVTGYFLLPCAARANEVGSEMMLDLWKYRTGEEDSGLLTGMPTKPSAAEPPAATASISGTVSFRERVTLLPQDEFEIKLLDISRQDATSAVIAKQNITSERQVPVPFKISYDPAKINPAHTYAVQARILRNGQVQFSNKAPCYVITHGHPNRVEMLLEKTETKPADKKEALTASAGNVFTGTYTRTFIGAGGAVEETLHIRTNDAVELQSSYSKGLVQQDGVWSLEGKRLAVTLTQKNGEYMNPQRMVFELKGNKLEAVEYDRNAHGPQYIFTRTVVSGQKK